MFEHWFYSEADITDYSCTTHTLIQYLVSAYNSFLNYGDSSQNYGAAKLLNSRSLYNT